MQKKAVSPLGDNGVFYVGCSLMYEIGLSPQRKSKAFLDKIGIHADLMSPQEISAQHADMHKTLSSPNSTLSTCREVV